MFLKKQTDSDEWMDSYPTALNAPLTDTQSLFQKAVTRGRKTNRKKSIVCGGKSICYYELRWSVAGAGCRVRSSARRLENPSRPRGK